MSLKKVNAGNGYQYLLSSVATNDAPRESGQQLSDYYAQKGTPPGRWTGRGMAAFGDDLPAGSEIVEAHMAALYGEGLHPLADEIVAQDGLAAARLGRSFRVHTGNKPVLVALRDAEAADSKRLGRRLSEEEKSYLVRTVGAPFFAQTHGREAANGREIVQWVNKEKQSVAQAVSGYDLTFSPVKSISVAWALADKDTAEMIQRCHDQAVEHTLAWAEDNVLFTRRGNGGIEQVKTRGMIAAKFVHFDTRAGDPDLHTHVLVSNKVQDEDGQWRSIDGIPLLKSRAALGSRYDAVMMDLMRQQGFNFEATSRGSGKLPVWELDNVPRALCEHFSSRRAMITEEYERLSSQYVAAHGRQPSSQVRRELMQAATLHTRDAKAPAQSLDQLRQQWAQRAGEVQIKQVDDGARCAKDKDALVSGKVENDVIGLALSRRSYVTHLHLESACTQVLMDYSFDSPQQRESAHQSLMRRVYNRLVRLTADEPLTVPSALHNDQGKVIDRRFSSEVFTSSEVLQAESDLMMGLNQPRGQFVSRHVLHSAIADCEQEKGFTLSSGQRQMVEHFVNSGSRIAVAVGAAGTGKTAAMSVVRRVWEGNIIGLAPSAAAAQVLSDDIDVPCHTIDRLTYAWQRSKEQHGQGRLDDLPIRIGEADMLLVDEAAMASTLKLAALNEIAQRTGCKLSLVGDPAQLDAVESGGIFRTMTRDQSTPLLDDVRRMGEDTAQAQATLQLREGNAEGLKLYARRGWIDEGSATDMLQKAGRAYLEETLRGGRSIVLACTNDDVSRLNRGIQHFLWQQDVVGEAQVPLADGASAGVGDMILARHNQHLDSGQRIINGQLLQLEGVHTDGGVTARDLRTGEHLRIDSAYVRTFIQLGYASTVHRAQGMTVDTCHAVIRAGMDRSGLYVAATRGKKVNRLYAVTDQAMPEGEADGFMAGDERAPSGLEVLQAVVARDTSQKSAFDMALAQQAEQLGTERLERLYRQGSELVRDQYAGWKMRCYFPDRFEPGSDEYKAVFNSFKRASEHGIELDSYIEQASADLVGAREAGKVIAKRLNDYVHKNAADSSAGRVLPADFPGYDQELGQWLENTNAMLQRKASLQAWAEEVSREMAEKERAKKQELKKLLDNPPQPSTRAKKRLALFDSLTARREELHLEAEWSRYETAKALAVDIPRVRECRKEIKQLEESLQNRLTRLTKGRSIEGEIEQLRKEEHSLMGGAGDKYDNDVLAEIMNAARRSPNRPRPEVVRGRTEIVSEQESVEQQLSQLPKLRELKKQVTAEEDSYKYKLSRVRQRIREIDPDAEIDDRFYTSTERAMRFAGISRNWISNLSREYQSTSYDTTDTYDYGQNSSNNYSYDNDNGYEL